MMVLAVIGALTASADRVVAAAGNLYKALDEHASEDEYTPELNAKIEAVLGQLTAQEGSDLVWLGRELIAGMADIHAKAAISIFDAGIATGVGPAVGVLASRAYIPPGVQLQMPVLAKATVLANMLKQYDQRHPGQLGADTMAAIDAQFVAVDVIDTARIEHLTRRDGPVH
jgi:hypothetical protein